MCFCVCGGCLVVEEGVVSVGVQSRRRIADMKGGAIDSGWRVNKQVIDEPF